MPLWSDARTLSWPTRRSFCGGCFFVDVDRKGVTAPPMVPQVSGEISPSLPLASQTMEEGGTGIALLLPSCGRPKHADWGGSPPSQPPAYGPLE